MGDYTVPEKIREGLAFLMLVEALIHHEFEEAARAVQGFSVQDCLL